MTVTVVPAPGIYTLNGQRWEIVYSQRGQWYAMRQRADGTKQYAAQNVNPLWLHGPIPPEELAHQPATCATPNCLLPVWSRGVCGMCLTRQAVERASRITNRQGEN